MSSYLTHYHFGQEVKARIGSRPCIDEAPYAFNIGLQGPDLYFYYFDKHSPAVGTLAHNNKIYEQFSRMLEYVKQHKDTKSLSYFYGMICHYAMDSVTHPYVYFMEEEVLPSIYPDLRPEALHISLETKIDTLIHKEKLASSPKCMSSVLSSDKETREAIADFNIAVFAPLFNAPIDRKKLIGAIKLFKNYQSLFDDPTKILPTIFKGISALSNYPPKLYSFIHPSVKEDKKGVDALNRTRRFFPRYRKEDEVVDWDIDGIIANSLDKAEILIEDMERALNEDDGQLTSTLYNITYDGNRIPIEFIE